jgi:hypothetical protein
MALQDNKSGRDGPTIMCSPELKENTTNQVLISLITPSTITIIGRPLRIYLSQITILGGPNL